MNTANVSAPRRRRFRRVAVYAFVIATSLRVWLGWGPALPRAQAQIPDPARQRLTLLEEARRTNQLLSDIKRLLESGTLNVRVLPADNQADRAPGLRP